MLDTKIILTVKFFCEKPVRNVNLLYLPHPSLGETLHPRKHTSIEIYIGNMRPMMFQIFINYIVRVEDRCFPPMVPATGLNPPQVNLIISLYHNHGHF